jgi:hypothetical protein
MQEKHAKDILGTAAANLALVVDHLGGGADLTEEAAPGSSPY